jgi:hypothetical protein
MSDNTDNERMRRYRERKKAATSKNSASPASSRNIPPRRRTGDDPEKGTRKTRRERFLSNLPHRVDMVMKELKLLANMSSSNYVYSQKEVDQIEQTLKEGVATVITQFRRPEPKLPRFTLVPDDLVDRQYRGKDV